MKIAIVYYSKHHGNTKKLLDAITAQFDVTLIDAVHKKNMELAEYDMVGFASGIYYSRFHESVLRAAGEQLLPEQKVFLIYTYGVKNGGSKQSYTEDILAAVAKSGAVAAGKYCCPGWDTFGPFKLVGGISKGRPNADDVDGAVEFFRKLTRSDK